MSENTPSTTLHGSEASRLRTDTERLLLLLHRGGNYSHLWTDARNRSYWFPIPQPDDGQREIQQPPQPLSLLPVRHVPKQWLRHNVYFSVHPLSAIPPSNTVGMADPRFISSQTPYICAVNALFAEFDGKDFVYAHDYQSKLPAEFQALPAVAQQQAIKKAQESTFYQTIAPYKARALRHIGSLPYPPSVIIDSGGGYHCYWLLRHTVPIDDANRADMQLVQHRWVQFVGGDRGAADLRRVLRLPGTYNHKPGLGSAYRVIFVKRDFGLLYDFQQLEEALNDWYYEQMRKQRLFRHRRQHTERQRRERRQQRHPATVSGVAGSDTDERSAIRRHFNQTHAIADLLMHHGYQLAGLGRGPLRLARPGRNQQHTSVTIFAGDESGRPERSIHFSTNDPLYSHEYLDSESGKLRRHLNDAFRIYVLLEHNGNWPAAYQAAARSLNDSA
ncbi:MAG: hypothetical protein KDE31_35605 [Caldilineaceae bacterium]|nr:hypothetical protein [Caldilineaceae bacterium]